MDTCTCQHYWGMTLHMLLSSIFALIYWRGPIPVIIGSESCQQSILTRKRKLLPQSARMTMSPTFNYKSIATII